MEAFFLFVVVIALNVLVRVMAHVPEDQNPPEIPSVGDPVPGIQFVGPLYRPPTGRETQCQVCGSPLERDLVTCDACATLHHRECWDYVRGCSTYGCRRAA